jgi:hypothetical protein
VLVGCRGRRTAPEPSASDSPPVTAAPEIADDVLDEVLEALQAREPECVHGLSTHAPMVAEAMCALGAADRVKAWVAGYGGPTLQLPTAHQPIARDRWREALGPERGASSWEGEVHRWADWRELLLGELRDERWQDVLDRWVARLTPGLAAAATHGVIRTGHIVRALARRDTPVRRAELASALAYWAAAYEELPARPHPATATDVATGLSKLPLYTELRGAAPGGNIVNGLREVASLDEFADARDVIAAPTELDAALSSLSSTFARVYLQHGARNAVAFVHAVTGPCALRRIAPHVRPETARAALPYAWQTAAAIYSAYARTSNVAKPIEPTLSAGELGSRALENGNDHAIKFTETLLAEHALHPDPAFLAAAEDAVRRL